MGTKTRGKVLVKKKVKSDPYLDGIMKKKPPKNTNVDDNDEDIATRDGKWKLRGTETGRLPSAKLPKTQKQLFDKIHELITMQVAYSTSQQTWDHLVSKAAASVTTYLVANKMVDLES